MRKSFISLLVGVSLALMAVFLMTKFKSSMTAAPATPKNVEIVQVVVATKDLPFGTRLMRDHLTYAGWPKSSVTDNNFTDMKPLLENADGQPSERVVIRPLFKGEPVIKPKVSGYGNKPTL